MVMNIIYYKSMTQLSQLKWNKIFTLEREKLTSALQNYASTHVYYCRAIHSSA